ncbi:helix-turn-helix domain-containing protein [Pseudomonas sp. C27(2019)]|uniref:RodZ domain-containing protein n=1 Tax=Pseudomonas sp. C27(2019) TaxID=2604941 RepID=UPI0012472123|nr:RodZ domain-containing protein [Pseudomonas sp. C27(2019)]QEY58362.1 helix-turn-helix domain-containing protein [Pseudomonas sp. C27(2019)]
MSDASLETDVQTVAVGDVLRNARLAADWTIAEVANKLNLTANAVESIEASQFERLPGVTFARGYIRSYAKVLGLNADQLVEQFDKQVGSSTIDSAVHSIDRVGEARRVSRGMLQFSAFAVFVIAAGAAYYAWQTFNAAKPQDSSQSAVFDRVEVERADGSVHVQTLDELEEQAGDIALESDPADSTELTEQSLLDNEEEQPVQTEQAIELNEASSDAQLQLEPGMGVLQLSFANDSWVRVQDADGTEISSGLNRAGQQLNVTGKAPLNIHLGYAKGVSIIYNGEPVDFSASISGETARITLGQ